MLAMEKARARRAFSFSLSKFRIANWDRFTARLFGVEALCLQRGNFRKA
jgi:hypothetical protein